MDIGGRDLYGLLEVEFLAWVSTDSVFLYRPDFYYTTKETLLQLETRPIRLPRKEGTARFSQRSTPRLGLVAAKFTTALPCCWYRDRRTQLLESELFAQMLTARVRCLLGVLDNSLVGSGCRAEPQLRGR
eukprot:65275-Rhodomonas_salina.2